MHSSLHAEVWDSSTRGEEEKTSDRSWEKGYAYRSRYWQAEGEARASWGKDDMAYVHEGLGH